MDACVIDVEPAGTKLVQTTDFFYPLVDDPYDMGKIACCNVLSDLYAMGVTDCQSMLMLLGVSTKLTDATVRERVVRLVMRGFRDKAREAGTFVTGGQTTRSPWFLIGGVATSVIPPSVPRGVIMPSGAQPGDAIVLTKPLGTRVAVNAYQFLFNEEKLARICPHVVSRDQIKALYNTASQSMQTLNRKAAEFMHKHGARACTDVTGFGLLGHARNLHGNQTLADSISFVIHSRLVFRHALEIDAIVDFGLTKGTGAETSGGLFVVLPAENAEAYCRDVTQATGWPACVIGSVENRTSSAHEEPVRFVENPSVIIGDFVDISSSSETAVSHP
ncbi:Selenide, water dikinase [Ramicandelaber brevisporus]|nr:Selenide, water dikinase [Ramicandelaber brevisporus]